MFSSKFLIILSLSSVYIITVWTETHVSCSLTCKEIKKKEKNIYKKLPIHWWYYTNHIEKKNEHVCGCFSWSRQPLTSAMGTPVSCLLSPASYCLLDPLPASSPLYRCVRLSVCLPECLRLSIIHLIDDILEMISSTFLMDIYTVRTLPYSPLEHKYTLMWNLYHRVENHEPWSRDPWTDPQL